MKQIIYIAIATVLLGLTSCNDWLDVSPKTSIPTDKQFETEAGFKDALTGIYLKLGTAELYAGDLTYAYLEQLAGLYSDYPSYNTNAVYNQSMVFDYENKFLGKKNGIYAAMYNIIANINNFLAYTEQHREVLVTENFYGTMRGEALGLRAFLHFDLLRLFGPIYRESPQGKAIPYRTTFDNEATPVLTAEAVVESLLKDLHEAERLLKESDPCDFFTHRSSQEYETKNRFLINREFRMNLYAVKAMLARVYCYKGDAQSRTLAVQYATEVINASQYFTLYKSQTPANYNSIRYAEQIFGITVNEFSKLLTANYMDITNTHTQQHFYLDGEKFDFFYESSRAGLTDWRRGSQMFEVVSGSGSVDVFCRKFNQKPLTEGYTYAGADAMPLIRLPEMYYIVAECATSAAESTEALNTVRFARGISYSDEILTAGYDDLDTASGENKLQTKRINEIMKEYRKEYFAEGQLFYFLKAHHYTTYRGCGVETMTETQYRLPLPADESIFGNNSK